MEAKNADGSWAGPDAGWTEGDKWAYSFDVVQDVDGLIKVRGGKTGFVESLDVHFDGGRLPGSSYGRITLIGFFQGIMTTRTRYFANLTMNW
jgi:putative alpha-1,2-mannosidase